MPSNTISGNNWLRQQDVTSLSKLLISTENSLVELQALESALRSGITMEPSRVLRVIAAINHLMVEIHLLAILKGETD